MPHTKLVPACPPVDIYVATSCFNPDEYLSKIKPGQYVYHRPIHGQPASWHLAEEVPDAPIDTDALQDEAEQLEARLREIYKQLGVA